MVRNVVVRISVLMFLGVTALHPASGDVRRERTLRRADVVEIGEPQPISLRMVGQEARHITEMQDYIATYGMPDYAEIQEIAPQWPWESYEVRLYYMQRDIETDFGHVFVSPAVPNFGALRYESPIPPDKRHQIEVVLRARQEPAAAPPVVVHTETEESRLEAIVARLEAATARAEEAANKAAEDSEAAARAADRTSTIIEKLSENPPPSAPRRRSGRHR